MSYSLLFDIGNVIVSFDFNLSVKRIAPMCSVSPGAIFRNISEFKDDLECGRITPEEFFEQAGASVGYTGDRDFLVTAFQDVFELNHRMVDLIEAESGKGTPLFLLSNTNGVHISFLFEKYPVFHLFDDAVYSHEVNCMKPDPGIYRKTVSQIGIDPGRTIYIDDMPENCEAGKSHGFHAIHYQKADHDRFLDQLEAAKLRTS